MTFKLYLQFLVVIFYHIEFAKATYSLVATDAKTRQVGGIGATCLPGWDVYESLYISAPNQSVLHTQGWLLSRDPEHPIVTLAKEKMKDGKSSSEKVLESMNEIDTEWAFWNGWFPEVDSRQYVIADFESSAAYTGSDLESLWVDLGYEDAETGDIAMMHGENDRFRTHAAGNVVASGTIQALQDGFAKSVESQFAVPEDDLAGRLMSALHRVIEDGTLGDIRCLEEYGTSATGAYLHIDNPDGTTLLHINIVDGIEPVEDVADEFLEWRKKTGTSDQDSTTILSEASGSNIMGTLFPLVATIVAALLV